jgi:hypothetical protein
VKAALVALAAFALGCAAAQPKIAGCPTFPADSPWNMRVDSLPVAANSDAIVATIGASIGLHPDFGSGTRNGGAIGIPYTIVTPAQKKVRVSFDYAAESDKGSYPIPPRVKVEAGSDRHALIVERGSCRLFELYALTRTARGWHAGSGAIWSLRSNRLRRAGWTSADAAGLPILPGLARYDEVAAGHIDHALRFTVERTRRAYVYPARHHASDLTDSNLPPMGLRLRLRASFDTRGFPPQARVVLEALKRYGMMVADNGSSWFISGAPDARWRNDDLHTLARVKGSDFEVVDPRAIRP